ncbi:hypothetical protein [Streptosporangium sp. NPDC051022]|uniref:hypothetical protein n=1 Tax=Streptosporangium sp. NPDC051022 TaxID=3155752 RepID=UPI0034137071
MVETLEQAVADIGSALAGGDLSAARRHFDRAAHGSPEAVGSLVLRLAATVEIPTGTVLCGAGIDVWGNPYRSGHAWRCGACPWTGSNYATACAARSAADKHAQEHPGITVLTACTVPTGAHRSG